MKEMLESKMNNESNSDPMSYFYATRSMTNTLKLARMTILRRKPSLRLLHTKTLLHTRLEFAENRSDIENNDKHNQPEIKFIIKTITLLQTKQ